MSPLQLELRLRRLEQRSIDFLARNCGTLGAVVAALALAAAVVLGHGFFAAVRTSERNGGMHIISLVRYALPIFLLGSPVSLFFSKADWRWLGVMNAAVWAVNVSMFFGDVPADTRAVLYALYPTMLLLCLAAFSAREGKAPGILPWMLFALVLAEYWLVGRSLFFHQRGRFETLWSLKPQYLLFEACLLHFGALAAQRRRDLLLAPAFVARGLLLPESAALVSGAEARLLLWWQGFLNICVGLAAALARLALAAAARPWPSPYFQLPLRYPLALLGIVAFLNVLVGLLRICGFAAIDATNFVWLSRTPAEYWRRGSVYSFLILQRYVYLPLLSRVRSPRLSRLVAFFVFINLKIGVFSYFILFRYYCIGGEARRPAHELRSAIHWFLWFVVLEVSAHLLPKTRLDEKPFRAWAMVLFTYVIMASLYLITQLIYKQSVGLGLL